MRIDDTVLFDEFARARVHAVELTDQYYEAPVDGPERDLLWQKVVCQTEAARQLLESWLECQADCPEATERELQPLGT